MSILGNIRAQYNIALCKRPFKWSYFLCQSSCFRKAFRVLIWESTVIISKSRSFLENDCACILYGNIFSFQVDYHFSWKKKKFFSWKTRLGSMWVGVYSVRYIAETIKNYLVTHHRNLSKVEWSDTIEKLSTDERKAPSSVYTFLKYFLELSNKVKDIRLNALADSFAQDFLHGVNTGNDNTKSFYNMIGTSQHDRSNTKFLIN